MHACAGVLLEPLLDGVEGVDGHGVDHGHLLVVVLVDDDHVKVLQVELHPLKVDQLHLVQGHHEGGVPERGGGVLTSRYDKTWCLQP